MKNNLVSLEKLIKEKTITIGRGEVISKEIIRKNLGNYPIYSSSIENDGKMGEYSNYMFDEDLITWSIDGGGNFFIRKNHKFSITNVCGFIKVDKNKYDLQFLYEILQFQHRFLKFDYQFKAHPSVIKKIYKVPIISLEEQVKISSKLSSINQMIKSQKLKITKVEFIKYAIISELMNFTETKNNSNIKNFESIISKIIGGGTPSTMNKKYWDGDIPWMTVKDMNSIYPTKTQDKISNKGLIESSSNLIKKNNIIVATRIGLGKACILNFDTAINQDLKGIYLKENVETRFVFFWYLSQSLMIQNLGYGTTVHGIRLKELKNLKIFVPKIEKQKKIAQIISDIYDFIEELNFLLKKFENLKNSIQNDIFKNFNLGSY
jgi:type I restriction enzyme, S subunit